LFQHSPTGFRHESQRTRRLRFAADVRVDNLRAAGRHGSIKIRTS
jgi:hypothetical protein